MKINELVIANGPGVSYAADGFTDAQGSKEINERLSKSTHPSKADEVRLGTRASIAGL